MVGARLPTPKRWSTIYSGYDLLGNRILKSFRRSCRNNSLRKNIPIAHCSWIEWVAQWQGARLAILAESRVRLRTEKYREIVRLKLNQDERHPWQAVQNILIFSVGGRELWVVDCHAQDSIATNRFCILSIDHTWHAHTPSVSAACSFNHCSGKRVQQLKKT